MNDIPRTGSTPWIELALNITGRIGALLPFLGWWMPKVPYMIVAMLVGSLVVLVLNSVFGADTTGIRTICALPLLSLPHFSLDAMRELVSVAVAATGLALTEAMSIAP